MKMMTIRQADCSGDESLGAGPLPLSACRMLTSLTAFFPKTV
jgi:hypothetical protein